MTLYKFNSLDEMEQMEAIWTGTELAKREADGYRITLVQIDSFYVEMYHHIEHDTLKRIRRFSSPDQLLAYLGQINIDELIGIN